MQCLDGLPHLAAELKNEFPTCESPVNYPGEPWEDNLQGRPDIGECIISTPCPARHVTPDIGGVNIAFEPIYHLEGKRLIIQPTIDDSAGAGLCRLSSHGSPFR